MLSRWRYSVWTGCVALLCLSMAAPAAAHPGPIGGLDVETLVSFRDEVRQIGHQQRDDVPVDAPELEALETIVIDPGHGGDNSGARGVADVPEKYLTLDIAYQLRERLQRRHPDLRVVMTRYGDQSIGLSERAEHANAVDADLLISLHYNAAPHDRAVGFETYFLDSERAMPGGDRTTRGMPLATADPTVTGLDDRADESTDEQVGDTLELIRRDLQRAHRHDLSGSLAETVQHTIIDRTDSIDRGVKQANFTILEETRMPAVVTEIGFLTHPDEGREVLGDSHRNRIVDGLVDAIEAFDGELDETGETDETDSDPVARRNGD